MKLYTGELVDIMFGAKWAMFHTKFKPFGMYWLVIRTATGSAKISARFPYRVQEYEFRMILTMTNRSFLYSIH